MSQTIPNFNANERITVSGLFTPVEYLSTNHWQKYPIEGIFSVTDTAS